MLYKYKFGDILKCNTNNIFNCIDTKDTVWIVISDYRISTVLKVMTNNKLFFNNTDKSERSQSRNEYVHHTILDRHFESI